MSDSRTELKATFSQFIDQLIDGELETIKGNISKSKKAAEDDIAELKETTLKEIAELRKGIEQERDALSEAKEELLESVRSVQQTVVDIHNDFTQKDSSTSQAVQNLAIKMAETFTDQDSEFRDLIESINSRVQSTENSITATAGDHDKLASVLQMFGTVAAAAPAQQVQPLQTQEVTTPQNTMESQVHESLPGDSDFLDDTITQGSDLPNNFEVDYSDSGDSKKVLGK